jgi:hypothetical protein
MEGDPNDEVATIGWNLFHDHRINAARFGQFTARLLRSRISIIDSQTMRRAIEDYHECCVQRAPNAETPIPHFLSRENSENFHDGVGALTPPHSNKQLVRVVNLTLMHSVFQSARLNRVSEFATYDLPTSRTGTRSSRTAWLDWQFADFIRNPDFAYNQDRLKRNSVLTALLQFVNNTRHTSPYEPAWTTLWSAFRDNDWRSPERWHKLVGLRPPQEPSWLLLLRYPVRLAGTLIRPTQLDGGWYPQHFPVPPSATVGHAMEMDFTRSLASPLPEYLHEQIDHEPEHLFALGRLHGPFASTSLMAPQQRHTAVLEREYSDAVGWAKHRHPCFR